MLLLMWLFLMAVRLPIDPGPDGDDGDAEKLDDANAACDEPAAAPRLDAGSAQCAVRRVHKAMRTAQCAV